MEVILKTKLTKLLNIKYPILQGAMAWVSEANLAAAVSNAGGAGIIGTGGRDVSWIKEQIDIARTLTDKPFGVNVILQDKDKDEKIDLICHEKVFSRNDRYDGTGVDGLRSSYPYPPQ